VGIGLSRQTMQTNGNLSIKSITSKVLITSNS